MERIERMFRDVDTEGKKLNRLDIKHFLFHRVNGLGLAKPDGLFVRFTFQRIMAKNGKK